MKRKIIFIGANNPETQRMINAINRTDHGVEFLGFLDNDVSKKNTKFCGLPVFGGFDTADQFVRNDEIYFVNLITRDCITRFETSRELFNRGGKFTNFIHPDISLEFVNLGVGNYIQEGVILQAGVTIGNNSSIHMGSLIGHESTIGNSSFIAHGCNVSGLVAIGDGVFMGTGTSILPRINIGNFCVIGAGSVIINDIPDYSTVVGNPGRVIKTNEKKYISANF